MFTGIIEEKARIDRIIKSRVRRIHITSRLDVQEGESIAVQGVCLTIAQKDKKGFVVEAMAQTETDTTLNLWQAGDYVNLERALRLGDRLGGHILLGHIDEVAKLIRIRANEYYFQIKRDNVRYLVPKGSIGVDGVSLTISKYNNNLFSVSLIPYTLKQTTLGSLKTGMKVNIEYDYLTKILARD
ncbi:hypothetical protein BXT86_03270 [candidate division WOR-3 bacterium 4484_100]|uniref:Riboflavin synthase n=1 Tax=candidate division WOR-3 bacterium 4484_100 TaxID=1936077 RepID=A0A1V4QFA2_UNCW3|nr:MAG: hypothetical protein BXT86_03270 [candidate division WOR-3 bacterium 4484_100]